MEEHGKGVDVVGRAPRREHVLSELVDVSVLPAVRFDVNLQVMPVALNCVGVRAPVAWLTKPILWLTV